MWARNQRVLQLKAPFDCTRKDTTLKLQKATNSVDSLEFYYTRRIDLTRPQKDPKRLGLTYGGYPLGYVDVRQRRQSDLVVYYQLRPSHER